MKGEPTLLEIVRSGDEAIVSFRSLKISSDEFVVRCRKALLKYIEAERPQTVVFDLAGLLFIPSALVGYLLTLQKQGIGVELANISGGVREILQVSNLQNQFVIRQS